MKGSTEREHKSHAPIMQRPIAVTMAGWLAIAWAAALAYSAVIFKFSTGRIEAPAESGTLLNWLIFVLRMLAPMVISVWMVVAAIGLLRLRKWARYWLFVAVALICAGKVGAVGTFGFSLSPPRTTLDIIVAIAFLIFLARPSVGALFRYRRSLKKIAIAMVILIAFAIAANVYMYIETGAHEIPTMKRVAYEPLKEEFYSGSYRRTELPLGFSIALPGDHKLLALTRSDPAEITAFLKTSEGHTIIMSNDPIIGRRSTFLHRMGSDPYGCTRALLTERFGVFCLILKGILLYPEIAHIDETVINGFTCFSIWRRPSDVPKTTRWVEYFIFNGREPVGQVQIFAEGQDPDMPDMALKPIVLSTRPEEPGKSAEAAFTEGLNLLERGQSEQAALAFARALCLNWSEPKYHYHLARTQLETGPLLQAREHAEEAMGLQPDFPGVVALLAEIEEAESRNETDAGEPMIPTE